MRQANPAIRRDPLSFIVRPAVALCVSDRHEALEFDRSAFSVDDDPADPTQCGRSIA